MTTVVRQAKGIPVGGQFAESKNPEATVALSMLGQLITRTRELSGLVLVRIDVDVGGLVDGPRISGVVVVRARQRRDRRFLDRRGGRDAHDWGGRDGRHRS